MIKKGLFVLLLVISYNTSFGQALATESGGMIYLNRNESDYGDLGTKTGYYVGPHILGDSVTQLLNKFEKEYVYYKQSGGAYSMEEKKIIKYPIYKAVHKVNSYYEKAIKKGKIDASRIGEVKKDLKMVLHKGVLLKNYYTEKVEEELKSIKSVNEIIVYFEKIKFRDNS